MAHCALNVLTVNTHKGFAAMRRRFVLHELRAAVREIGADVVFLQEVVGEHTRHSSRVARWPAGSHYEFLADTIWSQYAYGRNAVYPHGHHGNALLSKFPIVRHHNHDVSIGGTERRGSLHCVVDLAEHGQLHVFCVHLGLRESHRRRQVARLCQLIDKDVPADAPLVVAGDFNDWRRRADAALMRCAGLHEALRDVDGRVARTFPARYPILALDRIYVRHLEVEWAGALRGRPWSHLSDHLPLLARVQPLTEGPA